MLWYRKSKKHSMASYGGPSPSFLQSGASMSAQLFLPLRSVCLRLWKAGHWKTMCSPDWVGALQEGQMVSEAFLMWWSYDFCGPLSVRNCVYAVRAWRCQSVRLVP